MRCAQLRRVAAIAVFATFAGLAAPAAAGAATARVVASGSATLTLQDFAFSPQTLTVTAGTTVDVFNRDATQHTWSSDPGDAQQWDSGPIDPGGTFSVTFAQVGRFGYHCNIHSSMVGTIVVVAAPPTTIATTPPPSTPATAPGASAPTSVSATPVTKAGVAATALPRTGASGSTALLLFALGSVVVGATFVASGRRRRRESVR